MRIEINLNLKLTRYNLELSLSVYLWRGIKYLCVPNSQIYICIHSIVSLERAGKCPFWDLVRILAEAGADSADLLQTCETELQQLPPMPEKAEVNF